MIYPSGVIVGSRSDVFDVDVLDVSDVSDVVRGGWDQEGLKGEAGLKSEGRPPFNPSWALYVVGR